MQILACLLALVLCSFSRAERPAEKRPLSDSGLRQGDILIAVNGHRVLDAAGSKKAFEAFDRDEPIEFTVMRDGSEQTLRLDH